MTFPAVEVSRLEVRYGSLVVLRGFDLQLAAGESVALMGPSGSGKSSLLSCVTGMLKPSAGEVRIAGECMSSAGLAGRARFRRSMIGLIQQNPQLLPELTIAENVAVVLLFDGVARGNALTVAEDCLARVGLAGLGGKRIDEVSGGQAQRVALARALARPEIKV
ncbi:MAG: ATP-binding cassette domain-containing protein, partial [Angustibacter sp.]